MLNMLGAVAQFERSITKERQAEGIAKAKGKYKEREPDTIRNNQIIQLRESGLSIRKIATKLNCNPSPVQRALKPQP